MIASVSLEAERELIDGALYYAREANAELGLAFITEFERSVGVLCTYPRLGPVWRGSTRRFPLRRFPYSIIYQLRPDEVRVRAADLATGAAVSNGCVWRVTGLRPNPSLQRTRSGGLCPPTRAAEL